MKKLTVFAVALAVAALVMVTPAQAEDSGMLEISGNIITGAGWQRARAGRYLDTTAGVLTDGQVAPAALGTEQFGFAVDQLEVDLAKGFGENIRMRADLDYSPTRGPAAGGVYLEQGYVTANIPAGNGAELLVGRFNSGIGLDPIDRNELSTFSFSSVHRLLLPHNLTGARFGYDMSDEVRWELFVVNDLADQAPGTTSTLPSLGFNAVYTWGYEGDMSWFKFSAMGGPEGTGAGISNKRWSFLGDMALSYAATDSFRFGLEGVYRQDDALVADNAQFFAGTLQGTYLFSDVWDGTLRYGYTWDLDAGTATDAVALANPLQGPGLLGTLANGGVRHDLTLATGYAITDGAKLVVEGRFDLTNPSAAANGTAGQNLGLAGMFAYTF